MAQGTVNTTGVVLREGPDVSSHPSAPPAPLAHGTKVETISASDDNTWLLVSGESDGSIRIGWVPAQLVTVEGATTTPGGQGTGNGTGAGAGGASTILRGDGSFSFMAEVSGNDIVVHGVTATWFGGANDPTDNGMTASGVSTRDNPGIQGCALPMDRAGSSKTDGSPIPKLPWRTQVQVQNLQNGAQLTVSLIDLGPSKSAPSHAAIDLTQAAFQALGGSLSAGVMRVNYTILGAAKFALHSSTASVSLMQSEMKPNGGIAMPDSDPDHGQSHGIGKPAIRDFIASPNFSSRNGTPIDMIVMHFTDGPTAQGAINRFLNANEKVSAHYIIERNGDIFQMVRDTDKAWHAKNDNPRSIGIEHVCVEGDRMAPAQEVSSVALVRWLMATYNVPRSNVKGHRFAPSNIGTTDCPANLFGAATEQAVNDWLARHFPDA